jgi:hypothetical protein
VGEKKNMNVVKGFERSVDFWRQLSHGHSSLTRHSRLTSISCVNNQSHNLVSAYILTSHNSRHGYKTSIRSCEGQRDYWGIFETHLREESTRGRTGRAEEPSRGRRARRSCEERVK